MIKLLEDEFIGGGSVRGLSFKKTEKSPNSYLYEVKDGKFTHYEVFEIKLTPICIDFTKNIYSEADFKERYPKDEDFGTWAWTFRDFKKAKECFDNLTEKICLKTKKDHA